MIGLHKYMTSKIDPQFQEVLRERNSKALNSVLKKKAAKYLSEAGTHDLTTDTNKKATWKAKQLKHKYKVDIKNMFKNKWKEKAMHG